MNNQIHIQLDMLMKLNVVLRYMGKDILEDPYWTCGGELRGFCANK